MSDDALVLLFCCGVSIIIGFVLGVIACPFMF